MLSARAALVALAVSACLACAPSAGTLQVQLVTDYAPVRDFDTVSVAVEGMTAPRSGPAASDRSYGRPTRVATYDGVPVGRARITVSLSLGGRTVQSQPRFVDVRAGEVAIVTVPISRDCEGVACPDADAPSAIACLGGQCVDPGCSPAHPELCAASCAGGCGASPIACVDRACAVEGVCVDSPDDTRCAPGEICVANLGCTAPFSGPLDGGVGDAGLSSLTIEQFATMLGDHLCNSIALCTGPAVADVTPSDCARTFARAFLAQSIPRLAQAEAAGTFHYDGSFAAACLAAVDISPCENLVAGYPSVCENALLGRVAIGGGCDDSLECMGDAFCAPDGDGVCPDGTCTARRSVGLPCATVGDESADQQCARGLRCVSGACATPIAVGRPCTTTNACDPSSFCVGSGGLRHCGTLAEQYAQNAGQACNLVEGPLCMAPLSCTGTCIAALAPGAPCSAGIPDPCPTGQYCNREVAGSFACMALPGDGVPCLGPGYPLPCAGGLYCAADHVCHDLRPNGAACASAFECASQRCVSNLCTAPPLCSTGV